MQKLVLIAASSALMIPALFATEDASTTMSTSAGSGTVMNMTGTAHSGAWMNCMSGSIMERKDTRAEARTVFNTEVKRLTTEHKAALQALKSATGTTDSGSTLTGSTRKEAKKAADKKFREGMQAAQKAFNATLKVVRQDRHEDRKDCRQDIRQEVKTQVKELKETAKEQVKELKETAKEQVKNIKEEAKVKLEAIQTQHKENMQKMKERAEEFKSQREAAKAKYEELKKSGKLPTMQMGSGMILPPTNVKSTTESGSSMVQQ